MYRRFGRVLGTFLAAVSLFCSVAFAEFQKGVVNAEDVTVRESASPQSRQLEKLPRGAEVTLVELADGWYKIEYGELKGYVKQELLNLKAASEELSATGKVLLDDVNMRSKPSANATIVTQLKKGTVVEVSKKVGNWFGITSGKSKGYVQAEYIQVSEAAPAAVSSPAPAYNTLKMGMSGKEVSRLQGALKELGYYKGHSRGSYGAFTRDAVKAFQAANKLQADGIANADTQALLYSGNAAAAMQGSDKPSGAEALPWDTVDKLFTIDKEAKVLDVRSGEVYSIKRVRGVKHAEVVPLTKSDTDTMLKICGGDFTKDIWPVVVSIDGRSIAAAICLYPRGGDASVDNNMTGTLSMHFKDSMLEEQRRVSPGFQAAVSEAQKADLSALASAAPSPSPTPEPIPSPTATPLLTPTPLPTATALPTPAPSPTAAPAPTPTRTP